MRATARIQRTRAIASLNIGFISYFFAFLGFAVLTTLLLFSRRRRKLGALVTVACAVTAIWALASALATLNVGVPLLLLQFSELARDASWCAFLLKIIEPEGTDANNSVFGRGWNRLFFLALILAFSVVVLLPYFAATAELPAHVIRDGTLVTWAALSIFGLLLVEQLFRNTAERWSVKHLCLGLGTLFAYDFFMYSDALLVKQLNPQLWGARGVVNTLTVPLIAISIARNPKWELGIHVSRHVVFHSVTLIGGGIYLLAMAAVGYFIRFYGGSWGGMLQIVFFTGTGILLLMLLFSDQIRARVRVFLSKHFFSFKYDYREEWLRFTQTLAASDREIPDRIIQAVAALVHSNGGMLWGRAADGRHELLAHWNMAPPDSAGATDLDSLVAFSKENHWVIDLDEYEEDPGIYRELELPLWLTSTPGAWLITPLSFKAEPLGFVILKRSNVEKSINWEDRDLLKLAGQQAASHLAQYQADKALMEARQFEAFNRLSAYVVHDLKNILAQQSLIVSNAKRHKHNPEFIDDVIRTVNNSVNRMTRLMEQMRSGMRGTRILNHDLVPLLREVTARRAVQEPAPILESSEPSLTICADRDQLSTVFGHIIQNAQEATNKTGNVVVRLARQGGDAIVEIEDDGTGMDSEFIRNRLFRPFDSTKGLTGMGIGVFESREFIRAMGGNIEVRSTPGKGSLFRITLPCNDSPSGETTEA